MFSYVLSLVQKGDKAMDREELYECHTPLNPEERAKFNFLVNCHKLSIDEAYSIIEEERKYRFRKEKNND